eukprot:10778942-Alexandrium_andersonii.AAC.1
MSASLVGSEMCIRDRCETASGVRTWNCAGPSTTTKLVPEALEEWILRRFCLLYTSDAADDM